MRAHFIFISYGDVVKSKGRSALPVVKNHVASVVPEKIAVCSLGPGAPGIFLTQ